MADGRGRGTLDAVVEAFGLQQANDVSKAPVHGKTWKVISKCVRWLSNGFIPIVA